VIFCLGFVSKKLGEKTLFDSLFTCTFARARATRKKERETERKKERRETKNRDHGPRALSFFGARFYSLFVLDEWGIHARALVRWLDFLFFLLFFCIRGEKKTFFKNKKR